MNNGSARKTKNAGPFLRKGSRAFFALSRASAGERGGVIFYVFLAIALMAALTYFMTRDSRDSTSTIISGKTAQELYVQVNLIRSAVLECTLAYPNGGPDLNSDGTISTAENLNNPYPLPPTNANLVSPQVGVSATDAARNLSCIGAPVASAWIFSGAGNQGRFLPPAPAGFNDWIYVSDTNGVRIKISTISTADAQSLAALTLLKAKFATCQGDIGYGSDGANAFTAWIQRAACP